ncbi:MAG: Uma2 family endonuclease [Gemmataceae bacterium]|nr:Uma2 family endonuclease [Gemmataceae bacterium]
MVATLPTRVSHDQRFLFRDADWEMYEGLLHLLGDRPIRLTYDRGVLEIITLSFRHEKLSGLIDKLLDALADELNLDKQSGGSTTFRRQDLDRGLEPDECYYFENAELVRAKDEIDLTIDPPPDLAVEVDISCSSLNRLGIYAAIKVPEVWRYDGANLAILQLEADGEYHERPASRHFPSFPIHRLPEFLKLAGAMSETQLLRRFREWVRQELGSKS